MEDQVEHPTPEELEAFLDTTEELSELALEHPTPIRYYSLREGSILTETCSEKVAVFLLPHEVMTRDELDAGVLAAWTWSDRLYLAGRVNDDAGDYDPSGDYYVDIATTVREFAEAIVQMAGGKIRTREQMLDDPEHPGLADALTSWEHFDDSVYAKVRAARAHRDTKLVADRRAKLRWGMLPPPTA